jgi:hypothetical protein
MILFLSSSRLLIQSLTPVSLYFGTSFPATWIVIGGRQTMNAPRQEFLPTASLSLLGINYFVFLFQPVLWCSRAYTASLQNHQIRQTNLSRQSSNRSMPEKNCRFFLNGTYHFVPIKKSAAQFKPKPN